MKEDNEKISCHICKKEIPKAAALNAEGMDYVLHFCETKCLEFWKKDTKKQQEKSD